MATPLTHSVLIDAPPETVWAYVQDYDRRREWDTRVQSAENLTGVPLRRGSRVRYHFSGSMGSRFWMEAEYLIYLPGVRSAVRFDTVSSGSPFQHAAGSWRLESEDGKTRFQTTFSYSLKWGALGRLLDGFFVRKQVAVETEQSLENLKGRVEASLRECPAAADGRP